jgi:(5-formylfuran-3-yl)methyl phosphate synthase
MTLTAMLASVCTVDEALLALAGGADIVDLKDPAGGALGALDEDIARAIVAALRGRVRLSATIGDFPSMIPGRLLAAAERTAGTGVDFVKAGFFPSGRQVACARALASLAQRVPTVAVLFADCVPDPALIDTLAECAFAGVMLDTADKRAGSLLRHLDCAQLAVFVARARNQGLLSGLAGSLRLEDLPALLPLASDYIGFRGALCGGDRSHALDAAAFARVRAAIPRAHGNTSSPAGPAPSSMRARYA